MFQPVYATGYPSIKGYQNWREGTEDLGMIYAREGRVVGKMGFELLYDCRAAEGMSGAPILDARGDVVAVHRGSGFAKCRGIGETDPFFNVGVRLDLFFRQVFRYPSQSLRDSRDLGGFEEVDMDSLRTVLVGDRTKGEPIFKT